MLIFFLLKVLLFGGESVSREGAEGKGEVGSPLSRERNAGLDSKILGS